MGCNHSNRIHHEFHKTKSLFESDMTPFGLQLALVVFFIIIVCFGMAIVAGLISQSHIHIRNELDGIRRRYGGKFITRKQGGSIQFLANGTTFLVTTRRQGTKKYLRIKTRWPIPTFRMKVFPDTLDPKLKNFLGMQDIEIGSPKFDKAYVLQSNEPSELRRILQNVESQLLFLGAFDLTITTSRCTFEKEIDGANSQDEIVNVFVDAYFRMRDGTLQTDDIQMVVTEHDDSICMVCGEEIQNDSVQCRSCKTPHHQDCWEYLGMCSTYACGQKRYRIDKPGRIIIRPKKR